MNKRWIDEFIIGHRIVVQLITGLIHHWYISYNAPYLPLPPPAKFCITFVFSFPLGIPAVQKEIENSAYANVFSFGGGGANKMHYYSFKIFPQFWLARSTRVIHHNQLLMTTFGRILCLTRKWRQKCSLLQVNAPLTEKTWGRGWVVFVVKTKMADTSLVSRVRTTAGTRRNNG